MLANKGRTGLARRMIAHRQVVSGNKLQWIAKSHRVADYAFRKAESLAADSATLLPDLLRRRESLNHTKWNFLLKTEASDSAGERSTSMKSG